MRIVGCIIEYDGKLLLLYRHSIKSEGDTWGLPGGKVESGESDLEAIIREVYEETGYQAQPSQVETLGTFVCTAPSGRANDWAVHRIRLTELPVITLANQEHTQARWMTPQECSELPNLIYGVKDVLGELGYL